VIVLGIVLTVLTGWFGLIALAAGAVIVAAALLGLWPRRTTA
jgi:hypothetical protein